MELTPRQKSVYDFLVSHHRRYGFSPTVREICKKLGLAEPAGVHRILGVLEEKGFIRSTAGKKRSWRTVNPGNTHKMPVLVRIAAGYPMIGAHIQDGGLVIISPQPETTPSCSYRRSADVDDPDLKYLCKMSGS